MPSLEQDLKKHFTIGRIEDCSGKQEIDSHNSYILYIITRGNGVQIVDFNEIELKQSRISFISLGQMHKIDFKTISGYYIVFNLEFYHSVKSIFKLYDFPFFHTSLSVPYLDVNDDFSLIQSIANGLYNDFISPELFGKWSLMRLGLENLLIRLTRIKQKQTTKETDILILNNEKLRKLELLIEQNFKEHKEVAFYAEQLHLSSRHLNNIISDKIGKSISLMIRERLLMEVKRQLLHSEKTVAEIAYEVGFNDKAYFHRFFKKFTYKTPQEFRDEFVKNPYRNH